MLRYKAPPGMSGIHPVTSRTVEGQRSRARHPFGVQRQDGGGYQIPHRLILQPYPGSAVDAPPYSSPKETKQQPAAPHMEHNRKPQRADSPHQRLYEKFRHTLSPSNQHSRQRKAKGHNTRNQKRLEKAADPRNHIPYKHIVYGVGHRNAGNQQHNVADRYGVVLVPESRLDQRHITHPGEQRQKEGGEHPVEPEPEKPPLQQAQRPAGDGGGRRIPGGAAEENAERGGNGGIGQAQQP